MFRLIGRMPALDLRGSSPRTRPVACRRCNRAMIDPGATTMVARVSVQGRGRGAPSSSSPRTEASFFVPGCSFCLTIVVQHFTYRGSVSPDSCLVGLSIDETQINTNAAALSLCVVWFPRRGRRVPREKTCTSHTRLCHQSMRAVLDLGGDFVWDGDGLLMDWSRPAAAAAIYLFACIASNSARPRGQRPPAPPSALPAYIERYALAHNAVLVAFSALVCVCTSAHFAAEVSRVGLRSILCPPPQQLQPLAGPLHYWCYIFYLSKYYEMADTAILIARRKRIIPLHALHHAFIPLTMCILFDGGNSIALIGLGVVNSLVHVVMYSYYLCSDLGLKPPVTGSAASPGFRFCSSARASWAAPTTGSSTFATCASTSTRHAGHCSSTPKGAPAVSQRQSSSATSPTWRSCGCLSTFTGGRTTTAPPARRTPRRRADRRATVDPLAGGAHVSIWWVT